MALAPKRCSESLPGKIVRTLLPPARSSSTSRPRAACPAPAVDRPVLPPKRSTAPGLRSCPSCGRSVASWSRPSVALAAVDVTGCASPIRCGAGPAEHAGRRRRSARSTPLRRIERRPVHRYGAPTAVMSALRRRPEQAAADARRAGVAARVPGACRSAASMSSAGRRRRWRWRMSSRILGGGGEAVPSLFGWLPPPALAASATVELSRISSLAERQRSSQRPSSVRRRRAPVPGPPPSADVPIVRSAVHHVQAGIEQAGENADQPRVAGGSAATEDQRSLARGGHPALSRSSAADPGQPPAGRVATSRWSVEAAGKPVVLMGSAFRHHAWWALRAATT